MKRKYTDKLQQRERPAAGRLAELDAAVQARSFEIVRDAMEFDSVHPGTSYPPQQWVDKMGEEAALRKLRRVLAGQLPTKDAPVALKIALAIAGSTIRGKEAAANPKIAVSLVQMPQPGNPPQYKVKVLDVES
jgi:hypothetical protein